MTAITVISILAIIWLIASRLYARKCEDAEAMYWATVNEPLVFISETAFDTDVEARYSAALAKLKTHGNVFLTEKDVWAYVYRVDVPILGGVQPINMRHSIWHEQVLTLVAQRKAEWRELKAGYIGNHAGRIFGNQQQPSAN